MTNTMPLNDIFLEINEDLDKDANGWPWKNYYLDLEQDDKYLNRCSTDHQPSQLSTLPISEKQITKDDAGNGSFFHQTPDFLSVKSSNFRAKFLPELQSICHAIPFPDLQQLAIFIYQMSIIRLHQELWQCFLKFGTGQIKTPMQPLPSTSSSSQPTTDALLNSTLSWPKIVTSIIRAQETIHQNTHGQDNIDQDKYINFVQTYLNQLEKKVNQYQLEFDEIKNTIPYYNNILHDKLDHFVQKEGLLPMNLHFQARIALIKYIFIDRSYQLEYVKQKPTIRQLEIEKLICSLTYEKEKAQQEVILFQIGHMYHRTPTPFDKLEFTIPTSITTISDPTIRQRLERDYQKIIEKAKYDLVNIHGVAADAKKVDYEKKFEKEVSDIWKNQQQLPKDERLTPTMLILIEQRQKNIVECLKDIYHLKEEFIVRSG